MYPDQEREHGRANTGQSCSCRDAHARREVSVGASAHRSFFKFPIHLLRDGLSFFIECGDAGGALGAALFIWHQILDRPRIPAPHDAQRGSLLGPSHDRAGVEQFLDATGAAYTSLDEAALLDRVARLMADGKVVGWVHGRMEFGPRALGARSR